MEAQELASNTAAWYSAVASAAFDLPTYLVPENTLQFTSDDKSDFDQYMTWAQKSQNTDEWNARTELALTLYLDQRRRTRTLIISCSLMAAVMGGLMGYYAGKPKGGA